MSTPAKDRWDKAAVGINGLLAVIGMVGIIYAARTLQAVKRQADTMDSQVAQMIRELTASQRPWIYPTAVLSGPLQNSANGPLITVDLRLENMGNTPAVGIEIDPVMYILHASKPHPIAVRKRICEELTNRGPVWDQIVFPDKTLFQRHAFGATSADVEACKLKDMYVVQLIICVAYRSTFDKDARYYTGVIYDLGRLEPTRPGGHFALRVGQELPIGGMRLFISPIAPILAK